MNESVTSRQTGITTLSFVIPAHNEEECIDQAITQSLAELDALGLSGELIVVDDASTDRTPEIVANHRKLDGRVRLIKLERNLGAQRTIFTGFAAATGDAAFMVPADLQVLAAEVRKCLPALATADLVCTTRTPRAEGLHRRLMANCFNALVSRMVGVRVSDVDSCLLLGRDVREQILPKLSAQSDFLQAELVARCVAEGFRVSEVPVAHYQRAGGKPAAITPRFVVRTFFDFARLAHLLRRTRLATPRPSVLTER